MSGLANERCSACKVGAPAVGANEARQLLLDVPDWAIVTVKGVTQLRREYKLSDFLSALGFANRIAMMAEEHQHHPEITLGWGYVRLTWYTHKIKGLHRNDFVCAAKSDQLFNDGGC